MDGTQNVSGDPGLIDAMPVKEDNELLKSTHAQAKVAMALRYHAIRESYSSLCLTFQVLYNTMCCILREVFIMILAKYQDGVLTSR